LGRQRATSLDVFSGGIVACTCATSVFQSTRSSQRNSHAGSAARAHQEHVLIKECGSLLEKSQGNIGGVLVRGALASEARHTNDGRRREGYAPQTEWGGCIRMGKRAAHPGVCGAVMTQRREDVRMLMTTWGDGQKRTTREEDQVSIVWVQF